MQPTAQQDGRGPLPEGLARAIRETAGDIATLLKTTSGTAAPIPDSEWTVGEAAAHLALANELLADLAAGHERPYGDGTPQSLATANAQTLAEFGERGAQPLAAMITEQARLFLDAVDRVTRDESAPSPPLVTPLGPMDRHVLASYMLTHMLGHGYDLARALNRPHMIDRDRVGMCMPFMLSVMPRVVDSDAIADLAVRYAIRLRGGGEFGVSLGDGAVDVSPTPLERPDCTILIEPVTFLLIALGRRNPWRAIGQGQVLAWGAQAVARAPLPDPVHRALILPTPVRHSPPMKAVPSHFLPSRRLPHGLGAPTSSSAPSRLASLTGAPLGRCTSTDWR